MKLLMAASLLVIIATALAAFGSFSNPSPAVEEPISIQFGSMTLQASVADDALERTLGLSNTDPLADTEAKLFVFPKDDWWGIWMKDMRYPIDIIWLDREGIITHVEENVLPESYPTVYQPPVPSRYVIEGAEGLIRASGVDVGEAVGVPALLGTE